MQVVIGCIDRLVSNNIGTINNHLINLRPELALKIG